MLSKLFKNGYAIHGYVALLERISYSLINLFLVQKLPLQELQTFTTLVIYCNFGTLVCEMGSGVLFVNSLGSVPALVFAQFRILLALAIFIVFAFTKPSLIEFLFFCVFSLESLSRFPQFFQLRQLGLKNFYLAQFLKAFLLVVVGLYWFRKSHLSLDTALLILSVVSFVSFFTLSFRFFKRFFSQLATLEELIGLFRSGVVIFLSQLVFMMKISLPLWIIANYFSDFLREFRIFLVVYNILQQFGFIFFSGIYPKLVTSGKYGIEKRTIAILSMIWFFSGAIIFLFLPQIWGFLFHQIPMTRYYSWTYLSMLVSIPLNLLFLSKLSKMNSKGKFSDSLILNLFGFSGLSIALAGGIYSQEYGLVLASYILFDLFSLIRALFYR